MNIALDMKNAIDSVFTFVNHFGCTHPLLCTDSTTDVTIRNHTPTSRNSTIMDCVICSGVMCVLILYIVMFDYKVKALTLLCSHINLIFRLDF